MDISQNFVAFSEYMNFMYTDRPKRISEKQQLSVLKQMDENCNPYVVGEKKYFDLTNSDVTLPPSSNRWRWILN